MSAKDTKNNVFCYNTIDFVWRAGGIAVYGGDRHKIYNNYIRDCFMASGIHLNTTFPGYKFDNTRNIQFDNNVIVRCGCSTDTWRSEYGAVDITGGTKNVTFNNTYIYNAQHDGVRVGDQISNIVFNNLHIYGTGLDGQTPSYSSLPHNGAAVMAFGGNPDVTINGLCLCNIAYKDIYYNGSASFKINNVITENSYSIPDYPVAGTIATDHSGHITVPDIDEELKPDVPDVPDVPDTPEIPDSPEEPQEPEPYGLPDLIVTDITWNIASPKEGDDIVFSAVIKNIGTGVAPSGSINGGQFQIDGICVSWSDDNNTQIMPGESATITANGGPNGMAVWKATQGSHSIMAWINDIFRFEEADTQNNQLIKTIIVSK